MKPTDEAGIEARGADMACLEAPPPGPPGVVAREAETFEEFLAGMLIITAAFEMDEAVRTAIEERAAELWTFRGAVGANALFVALVGDDVVAFGGARFGRTAVYLSGAGTHPEHRGSGAYRALVRARWDAAVEHGTPVLTVGAGVMSRPILERLGFSIVGWTDNLVDELG
jgi:GNAT superfamily N-acetyltransferase